MKKVATKSVYQARVNSDGKGRFRVRVFLSSGDGYSSEMLEDIFREFCGRIDVDFDLLSEAASEAVTVVDDISLTSDEIVEFGFANLHWRRVNRQFIRGGNMQRTMFKVFACPPGLPQGNKANPANFYTREEAERFREDYLSEHPGYTCEIEEAAS
jgi:hypothetical protein